MENEIKNVCLKLYEDTYNDYVKTETEKLESVNANKQNTIETAAQKKAIRISIMESMKLFPEIEVSIIWKIIYEIHVQHKSGIGDYDIISKIISADQSWKKSSGHAFEEMIKILSNDVLAGTGIEVVLQTDLHDLINLNRIANEPRDISWLKEQIKASIFDLYVLVDTPKGKKCFGCIQSKTSIRDRVTRDREPSLAAMASTFWSIIFVLDGEFLKNQKFQKMVNGGNEEFKTNGWHGMYVFSEKYSGNRIYSTDLELKNFKDHAIKAAEFWQSNRQWLNSEWDATKENN